MVLQPDEIERTGDLSRYRSTIEWHRRRASLLNFSKGDKELLCDLHRLQRPGDPLRVARNERFSDLPDDTTRRKRQRAIKEWLCSRANRWPLRDDRPARQREPLFDLSPTTSTPGMGVNHPATRSLGSSFRSAPCGPPIELDDCWLLLTHGVGPVRKYSIGAVLLDKNDPSKVLARAHEPLVRPEPSEREGYVPNVVYTCGAMRHGDQIILPYAVLTLSPILRRLRLRP